MERLQFNVRKRLIIKHTEFNTLNVKNDHWLLFVKHINASDFHNTGFPLEITFVCATARRV